MVERYFRRTTVKHYSLPPDVVAQLQAWNATIEQNRDGVRFGESRVIAGLVRWAKRHGIDVRKAFDVDGIERAPQKKKGA
jgi:hypothetical protein